MVKAVWQVRKQPDESNMSGSSSSLTFSASSAVNPVTSYGQFVKLFSAAFYAVSSFLIVIVNKTVLTTYRFPSYMFLGIGQMACTIIILYLAKTCKAVSFQDFDKSLYRKIFPLPLLYVGNHITGLGSTKKLSLPMFTVLRKFTIPLTMIMEANILSKSISPHLACSVVAIVLGALIAASSDLAFEAEGYAFVLLNDVFTAANGVYTKQKLGIEGLGKYGVLFYNAFIIIIPTILSSACTGDLEKAIAFKGWISLGFIFYFLLSCFMGFILMYSIVLCSHHNSALTTTVIGAIKNVAVAYIGMFIGGDYAFSWPNFVGLNICISGGLVYAYLTFHNTSTSSKHTTNQAAEELGHVSEKCICEVWHRCWSRRPGVQSPL
ncbi:UDP-N-acetylglucosamine/UDP-glucose/GDP-mannose transporter isoform X2 [Tachysurus fulvidraco]|uniref:UDP-N-acetylglucosamine/UDP-glucose/GDP-mannose transporter isoform X2 n=1 Tax=Tachysurus fulvidraco TaxID=1234273 RepID=UPI000F4DE2A6|nr:UDP-N-acetylglucosamine/UDP-glucose/GDP-mannose transporter isoform X2 [Tachysurus fulvidraco]